MQPLAQQVVLNEGTQYGRSRQQEKMAMSAG